MSRMKDLVSDIETFESGEMSEDEQVGFMAWLYNTGFLRSLQDYYQRTFADHVSNGDITFTDDNQAVTRF